jgi:hypothetical protein
MFTARKLILTDEELDLLPHVFSISGSASTHFIINIQGVLFLVVKLSASGKLRFFYF